MVHYLVFYLKFKNIFEKDIECQNEKILTIFKQIFSKNNME